MPQWSFNARFLVRLMMLGAVTGFVAACGTTEMSKPEGYYKVGTPYQIKGVWYYPKEDPEYDETGVASWYGADFHGKKTANGERYNMNALTAAHRTLPMPTFVNVTNLENGKQIKLRVNDRGPFARGRIIDVSKRAAELLGFVHHGVAKVRVQFAGSADGRTPVAKQELKSAPVADVSIGELAPVGSSGAAQPVRTASVGAGLPNVAGQEASSGAPDETVTQVPTGGSNRLWVQAGAFSARQNAARMVSQLTPAGRATVSEKAVFGRPLYRVRVGPLASVEDADRVLDQVIAMGYNGARVVVD